jgi:putative tryptophan/tyrosine transport system substrate-binding protein
MMKRRGFITLLGGAAAAWPLVARAQQAMPVIGFLSSRAPTESADAIDALRRGLRESGFVEGQNLVIAFRWAEGRSERLAALAAELVEMRMAVLFAAGGTTSALAAKAATQTIPIVFSAVPDPVGQGLVPSLNRPGGNVTGMSAFSSQLWAKCTELLKELVPSATAIVYLVDRANAGNPGEADARREAIAAASALNIQVHVLNASTEHELDEGFASLTKLGAKGAVLGSGPFFLTRRDRIVALAAQRGVATIYPFSEFVAAGGLMSYGSSLTENYRQAGIYVGRILKGEKPADQSSNQNTLKSSRRHKKSPSNLAGAQFPVRSGQTLGDRSDRGTGTVNECPLPAS